jgi:hypothetical protein
MISHALPLWRSYGSRFVACAILLSCAVFAAAGSPLGRAPQAFAVESEEPEEPCRLSPAEQAAFLPRTAPPKNLRPLAEPGHALPGDCGFYKWAWQAFLDVTQVSNGRPQFLSLPTYEDVFKVKESTLFANQQSGLLSLAPRRAKVGNKAETAHFGSDDLLQAVTREVLIDPKGNAIWYAIHLNRTYKDFIDDYDLRDPGSLAKLPQDLTFRTGSLELKSAWKIVEGAAPKNYITANAVVPVFKTAADGNIVKDGDKTRLVTVALLGLHVVGTIEGHPEFVWSTFEHVSHEQKAWIRDVAPAAKANPDPWTAALVENGVSSYALYPADKGKPEAPPVKLANDGNAIDGLKLDAKQQTFTPHSAIYRVFPGSKSDDSDEDDAVTSLNADIQRLFETLAPTDVRSNYQLVGAVWLNTPEQDFKAGVDFSRVATAPRNQPLFGGEDRLSSTTMESFTQPSASFPNCFSCHNTESVSGLPASRLDVSHALSKFYSFISDAKR